MAKAKKKSAKRKYKGSPTPGQKACGCGSAKPARIKHSGGKHTMCRGSRGRFTKLASCQ